jgi:hypothetical protein
MNNKERTQAIFEATSLTPGVFIVGKGLNSSGDLSRTVVRSRGCPGTSTRSHWDILGDVSTDDIISHPNQRGVSEGVSILCFTGMMYEGWTWTVLPIGYNGSLVAHDLEQAVPGKGKETSTLEVEPEALAQEVDATIWGGDRYLLDQEVNALVGDVLTAYQVEPMSLFRLKEYASECCLDRYGFRPARSLANHIAKLTLTRWKGLKMSAKREVSS